MKSGPQSLRSPISVLKDNSPVLFQSLPSSPKKKNSVKRVITSELFSSDKDISRSLELVYTEPNDDPKEKLSTIYKSVAPLKQNLVERKPSFTKIKRPSIEYDIHSGSSSPEWRVVEGKSIDFSPCNSSHDYSFQKMSIPISSSSSPECQISKDICSKDPPCVQLFDPKSQSSVRSPERKFQYVQGLEEQYSANVEERIKNFQKEDVRKLSVILGHEPENKELADIQDNKTDDDQPDLETDESSGEKNKIKLDVSMEGFTEATDITTPVEMAQESAPSKRDDFDTSYQISDIPAEFSKYDNKITSPATLHRETLFEITDLEDLTDIEETKEDIFVQQSSRSDQTLVADTSPKVVDTKIKRREKNIDRKFERLSMDLSDTEMNVEKEMFVRVSTQISKEDEEQAARSFDKIMFDNFAEDKSEDWLTHGSEPTPEKEVATDIFGEPDHEALQDKLPKKDMVTNLTESTETGSNFDKAMSREQSFVYDTSVEAFGSKGEVIDEHCGHNKIIEEECMTGGISFIGQIAGPEESTDEIRDFIESNTPSKESQVEKFEYVENEDFDINEDNISTSPEERPESDKSDIVIEELNENLKIPLSSSPLKVDTLFLTESTESQSKASET